MAPTQAITVWLARRRCRAAALPRCRCETSNFNQQYSRHAVEDASRSFSTGNFKDDAVPGRLTSRTTLIQKMIEYVIWHRLVYLLDILVCFRMCFSNQIWFTMNKHMHCMNLGSHRSLSLIFKRTVLAATRLLSRLNGPESSKREGLQNLSPEQLQDVISLGPQLIRDEPGKSWHGLRWKFLRDGLTAWGI